MPQQQFLHISICWVSYLTSVYVEGLQNGIADSLSRFQVGRFRELAPKASPTGYPTPKYLINI